MKLKWQIFAGGTCAAEGKYAYHAKTDHGEYDISPVTTATGRHAGYLIHFVNTKGKVKGGLWHNLGTCRSPNAAKRLATDHYEALLRKETQS